MLVKPLFMSFATLIAVASLHSNPSAGRNLLSIEDLNKKEIELILDTAEKMEQTPHCDCLKECILATCFFEPSTRTRLSFESAAHRLSASIIGFSDSLSTSVKKGESLFDTIKTVSQFADLIVIRHPVEGSAHIAAKASTKPVINGGDGANEHPTQTLLDLFSIRQSQGKIDGLKIAIVGDLKYGRTIHSLCKALTHYQVSLYFVYPQQLPLPDDLYKQLTQASIPCSFHNSIEEVISKVDILYMTRIQKERLCSEESNLVNSCILKKTHLASAKENLKILHPMPRVDEIETSIDETPYAYYFQQSSNGVLVRMALLRLLLDK